MVDGHETFQGINPDNENEGELDQSSVDSEFGEEEEQYCSGLGDDEYSILS